MSVVGSYARITLCNMMYVRSKSLCVCLCFEMNKKKESDSKRYNMAPIENYGTVEVMERRLFQYLASVNVVKFFSQL